MAVIENKNIKTPLNEINNYNFNHYAHFILR